MSFRLENLWERKPPRLEMYLSQNQRGALPQNPLVSIETIHQEERKVQELFHLNEADQIVRAEYTDNRTSLISRSILSIIEGGAGLWLVRDSLSEADSNPLVGGAKFIVGGLTFIAGLISEARALSDFYTVQVRIDSLAEILKKTKNQGLADLLRSRMPTGPTQTQT